MAFVSINQFKGLVKSGDSDHYIVPVPYIENGQETITLSHSTASVQSSAFASDTAFIRIVSDVACFYEIGSNPTAANTGGTATRYLPANVYIFERCEGGDLLACISTA